MFFWFSFTCILLIKLFSLYSLLTFILLLSFQTPDLESPINKRSSEGSHMLDEGNSPVTI
ncbi:hypothetical protein Fmac_012953 [Flemingia macrophylla]|uniref:Uncharacterized protein n=1 Tax=Flemingia macrophylla TaxID=520843 RepID=A0ABD1MSL1_9FABA